MSHVLVLGAGGSAAANFARSIAEEHDTVGVDTDPWGLELAATTETHLASTSVRDPRAHLAELQRLVDAYEIDLIHAQPDPEALFVAQYAHELGCATLVPPVDLMQTCQSKLCTASQLRGLAPATLTISQHGRLEHLSMKMVDLALDRFGGQAWLRPSSGAGAAGAIPIDSVELAMEWMGHHRRRGVTEWIASEILPGRDLSWTGVYVDGELIGEAAKERLDGLGASRHPGGVSSTARVQRILPLSSAAARVGREAIAKLCMYGRHIARGIFMVDMREDAAGEPRVTEVNGGRFGTTVDFYARAGCNLPLVYVNAAIGLPYELGEATPGLTQVRQMDMGSVMVGAEVIA